MACARSTSPTILDARKRTREERPEAGPSDARIEQQHQPGAPDRDLHAAAGVEASAKVHEAQLGELAAKFGGDLAGIWFDAGVRQAPPFVQVGPDSSLNTFALLVAHAYVRCYAPSG